MTAIAAITEDFNGGSAPAEITTANSVFDNVGANRFTFSTDSHPTGAQSAQLADVAATPSVNRIDITGVANLWYGFYIKLAATPTTATAIATFYLDDTKVGDVRVMTDGSLQIRSVNTSRGTSGALDVGSWYRVAVRFAPTAGGAGICRLRLYGGANLDTNTAFYDSTDQVLTAAVATVNNVRIGASSADATLDYVVDRLRGDDTNEPTGLGGSGNLTPTAVAGADQTGIAAGTAVTLDGSGSSDPDGTIATYNWAQTAGTPSVTLTGTGATRTFTAPSVTGGTTLTFGLTVTDNGGATSAQDTMTVAVNAPPVGGPITELTEDFTGSTNGTAITLNPGTIFDSVTGAGANSVFSSTAYDGTLAMLNAPGGTDFRVYRADFTARTNAWIGFYFRVNALPTASTAILAVYSGTTKIADIRVLTTGAIQIRSVSTDRWSSTPVATGTWHRLAVRVAPTAGGTGTLRLRLYEGTSRDSTIPSQDSGNQAAAALAATADNIRLGGLTSDATLAWAVDRIRADDTTEPPGITVTNIAPVANAGADQAEIEPYSTVTVSGSASTDADGTITNHVWTQLSGPTVTIVGSGTGARTFVAPATVAGTTVVLGLVVVDNNGASSTQDSVSVVIKAHNHFVRHTDGLSWVPRRRVRVT